LVTWSVGELNVESIDTCRNVVVAGIDRNHVAFIAGVVLKR